MPVKRLTTLLVLTGLCVPGLMLQPVNASACVRNSRACPSGGGGSEPRRSSYRDANGNLVERFSIANGSTMIAAAPPPTCRYATVVTGTELVPGVVDPDAPDDAPPPEPVELTTVNTQILDNGRYFYEETGVRPENTNADILQDTQAWVARFGDAGDTQAIARGQRINYTPLEQAERRFTVECEQPDDQEGAQDRDQRLGLAEFVDVGPNDPYFDVQSRITDLYSRLQLDRPRMVDDPVLDNWPGLVVRSPAWLAVDPDSYTLRTSPTIDQFGWELQLVAVPRSLGFTVDFVATEDRHRDFDGTTSIDCLNDESDDITYVYDGQFGPTDRTLTATSNDRIPARPRDLTDFAQPGPGQCTWTPPARGQATITANVVYSITFLVSGYGMDLPDYEWQGDPTTYRTGELRAVNTNRQP